MARGRPAHYLGHNPAGAMMIYALIVVLILMVLTGFIVQGGDLKQGPLAGFTSFAVGETVRAFLAASRAQGNRATGVIKRWKLAWIKLLFSGVG